MIISVHIDITNLYFGIKAEHEGYRLDYDRYLTSLSDLGDVRYKFAYGSQIGKKAKPFLKKLTDLGITTRFETLPHKMSPEYRMNWAAMIALDAVSVMDRTDIFVFGTGDSSVLPLVHHLKAHGKRTVAFGCNVGWRLREAVDYTLPIPASLLMHSAA